jgi:hypothetical protein
MGRLRFGCLMFVAGVVFTLVVIIVIVVLVFLNGNTDLFPFL